MNNQDKLGLYLFEKNSKDQTVLRDLILLLKKNSIKKNLSFSYIEAESSLHPELSLWENLRLVTGSAHWREFCQTTSPLIMNLLDHIKNCDQKTSLCTPKEKFVLSFIQGFHQRDYLLIDLNEDILDFKIIHDLKELFINQTHQKKIFLASACTGLWIDCAHSLFQRSEIGFKETNLNINQTKKFEAA